MMSIKISSYYFSQKVITIAVKVCANLNSHIIKNYCLSQAYGRLVFEKTGRLEVINFSCSNLIWLIEYLSCFYSSA